MKKLVSILLGTGFVLLLATLAGSVTSQEAQAQFTVGDDFKVAWSLDPRADPANYTRGPGFGAGNVLVDLDLDGDGKKEFLFGHDETLAPSGPDPGFLDVYLYESTGDDTYEYVWHYSHNLLSNSFPALATGDMDGDGLNEIFVGIPTVNDDPNDLLVFEQDVTGVFPDIPTVVYDYGRPGSEDFRPSGMQLVDVDGDGKTELLTTSRTGSDRELVVISLMSDDLNEFAIFNIEFEVGETVLGGGRIDDVMVVDYDGDGSNEIWVNTWDNWSMAIFEVTGPDTYQLQVDLNDAIADNDPGSFNRHDMNFADYDGDGKMEAYFPMTNGKLYYIDDLADVSTFNVNDIQLVGTIASRGRGSDVGDLDGDGLTDIVTSNGVLETVSRIEYDGVGDRADSTSYSWTTLLDSSGDLAERYYPLRIANDMDGDGQNEVVITNRNGSSEGQPIIIILESTDMPVAVESPSELPDDYVLHQNYPNPFNPTTEIQFDLPVTSAVSVRVYNVMGRLVRVLVDSRLMEVGRHTVRWDGRDGSGLQVASGTYIYTLEYGQKRKARTMVMLK